MIFKLHHDRSWPPLRGEVFGVERVCSISGCTFYLDLREDLKEWFKESGIDYRIEGVTKWREAIHGETFDLVIPNETHATIFKLRWL